MIKIKVPATSANFCIGFDTLGVALNLYNEFSFETSTEDKLLGFDKAYNNESNLVLISYKRFFSEFNIDYIPVTISLLKEQVPPSRGLGSSATCIVAGIMAANILSNANIDSDALLSLMTLIEGHPDNVAPAYLGGFVASINNNGDIITNRYNVSDKLVFNVLVPDFKLSTLSARQALPNQYSREDVVSNISKIINLPRAIETANFKLLKVLLNDKIHEPYRFKLIDKALKIKEELA
ncbi:MAG: homoserine kinase, partial [Acholeplasmatales bacterium]|nr:homoserine kinase [Acholeplasmatales bacterium]